MSLQPIALPDAQLAHDPHWLTPTAADALFARLRQEVEWEVHRIRLFGREVDSPRLSCWIGEPDAGYRYSGAYFEPRPWPPVLQPIRARLARELGVAFNSVLANLYRTGADSMGWHSDDERELGATPVIASLSLGAERRFLLKHRREPERKRAIELGPGSLLVMSGNTQRHYRHSLPRTARAVGERINLTFRVVGA